MIKKTIYLILLVTFLLITGCDNDDFVSPYDPSYKLLPPSDLKTEQIAVNKCKVSWKVNSLDEEGFRIARKKDGEEWVNDFAVLAKKSNKFIDDTILLNSTYKYRVAVFADKYSSSSIESSIVMGFPKPTNLQITQLSVSVCKLTWEDNCLWEEGYKIAIKKDEGEWIESYAIVPANCEEFIDTALLLNSTYYYRITTYVGDASSNHVENSISIDFPKPTNLQITQIFVSACKLTWEDNCQWEEGYKISRKKDNEEWIEDYAFLAANAKEFVDDEVDIWRNYSYRVSAFYEEIFSDFAEINLVGISENFVYVPGGTFTMGRTTGSGNADELPIHQVTLSSFAIYKYEVTQAEYQAVMGTNPSYFTGSNYPVERVTWYNAVEYCNARSTQEGLTPCYNTSSWSCDFNANGYRLPTEAEWEYASRGATINPDYLYSGSDNIDNVAWYSSNSNSTTHPVGTKAPNSLGIYDMSGNVCEWCNDWYGSYSSGAQTDPVGPASGSHRVNRGGGWSSSATYCRVSDRYDYYPTDSRSDLGFRVARSSK